MEKKHLIKDDIITLVCKSTGFSKYTVEEVINATLQNIVSAMSDGSSVQFAGFGTFEVKHRAARMGRNPHTNTPVPIPARVMPAFKVGSLLKDAVCGHNK